MSGALRDVAAGRVREGRAGSAAHAVVASVRCVASGVITRSDGPVKRAQRDQLLGIRPGTPVMSFLPGHLPLG